jgi:hypothetical protein
MKQTSYEIHLVLEVNDIEKFKKDCGNFKTKGITELKPVFIETENSKNEKDNQLMVIFSLKSFSYEKRLNALKCYFTKLSYKIIREKVKINTTHRKNDKHLYYESHIRLCMEKDFNLKFKSFFLKKGFHLSKNLFKTDDKYNYQFLTYRTDGNVAISAFHTKIWEMIEFLKENDINNDKIEIEECIYDTNIQIDNNWLN